MTCCCQEDLVSIIIPVYNMENSLEKCIDSILSQSFTQIEVILIDDGSIDQSGIICDRYAQMDNRISVIHKSNSGVADATNTGLDHASGNYVMFVDSDDFIDSNMADSMINTIKQTNADIVQCGMVIHSLDGTIIRNEKKMSATFEGTFNILEAYFLWKGIGGNLAAKMFKASLFHDIRMPSGRMFGDIPIIPQLLKKCEKYVIIKEGFYHVTSNPKSVSRGELNNKTFNDITYSLEVVCEFIKSNYPSLLYHTYYLKAATVANYYERIKKSTLLDNIDEKLYMLKHIYKINYRQLKKTGMFNKYPPVRRGQLYMFYIHPNLSIYAEKIYRIFKAN